MELAKKKSEFLTRKKTLLAQLELNKTQLKLEELKLKSKAQEQLVAFEAKIGEIDQELESLEGVDGLDVEAATTDSVPISITESVPIPFQRHQYGSRPTSSTGMPSPDYARPTGNFQQPAGSSDQTAMNTNLENVFKMFAHSLSEMVTMPRRSMPRFNGDPLHFYEFTQVFDSYVAKYQQDPRSQLLALIECCDGESKELIKACAAIISPNEGLSKAKSMLWYQYGQRHIIVHANLRKLSGPALKGGEKELRELANAMLCCGVSLKAWGYDSSLNSQDLITTVLKRLPKYMQFEFHRSCQKSFRNNQDVAFDDLTAFVQEKASMASDFIGKAISTVSKPKDNFQSKPTPKTRHVFATRTEVPVYNSANQQPSFNRQGSTMKTTDCPLCKSTHPLHKCKLLLDKSVAERWNVIKTVGVKVCFNCLGLHHIARDCASHRRCRSCSAAHHTLLHRDKEEAGPSLAPNVANTEKSITCASTRVSVSKVRLKVLPVTVWDSSKTNCIDTYAFLDEGADTTLCSHKLLSKLNISEAEYHPCTLQTINGSTDFPQTMKTVLSVKGFNLSRSIELDTVFAVPRLPDLSESIPRELDTSHYPYLCGIKFPELVCQDIDLLIGADVQAAHRIHETRYGPLVILTT